MGNKLVPRLRFKEFNNNWKRIDIGSISSVITKGTSPKMKVDDGDVNFIKIEDINTNNGNINTNHYITQKENNGYLKRSQLKDGDILFSIAGTLGRIAIVHDNILPANTNQALAIIRLNSNEDINFLQTILKGKTVKDYIRKNPTIGAQPNLSLKQVSNLSFNTPLLSEQQKIGQFFSKLDRLIDLQSQKLSHLKQLKKGYLQKMFPQKGESVPRLRFDGFRDEWKKDLVGSLMKVSSSKRVHMNEWTSNGIPFLRARDIVAKNENRQVDNPLFINKQTYHKYSKISGVPKIGDLLVTGVGTIGQPLLIQSNTPFYFKDGNIVWFHNNYLNKYFFFYFFNTSFIREFIKSTTGVGTVATYTIESGRNTPILFPSYKEQKEIGYFFQHIDKSIKYQQDKLNNLNQLKKAYLQKMFI